MYDDELMHYGVKGMKWGVRRYQNADGSLTEAGKKRYGYENDLSARQVQKKLNRISKRTAKNDYDIATIRRSKYLTKWAAEKAAEKLVELSGHNNVLNSERVKIAEKYCKKYDIMSEPATYYAHKGLTVLELLNPYGMTYHLYDTNRSKYSVRSKKDKKPAQKQQRQSVNFSAYRENPKLDALFEWDSSGQPKRIKNQRFKEQLGQDVNDFDDKEYLMLLADDYVSRNR